MERFFWVDIHYACFGVIATDGTVTDTAPIARWMVGKALPEIKPWLLKKNAKVVEIQKREK